MALTGETVAHRRAGFRPRRRSDRRKVLYDTRSGRGKRRARNCPKAWPRSASTVPTKARSVRRLGLELISRTHFARFLVEAGHCRDPARGVPASSSPKAQPGYVPHRWASLKDAVHWITADQGHGRDRLTPAALQVHGQRGIRAVPRVQGRMAARRSRSSPAATRRPSMSSTPTRRSNSISPPRAAAISTAPTRVSAICGKLPPLPGALAPVGELLGAPHPAVSQNPGERRSHRGSWRRRAACAQSPPPNPRPASSLVRPLPVAVACFATLDTATKPSTAGVPILMGVWFRYAFQAVATTAVLLPLHGTALLRTRHRATSCCAVRCCWCRARWPSLACATCRWPSSRRSC